jgi:hypothetical protein
MKPNAIALVSRANKAREEIATYLRGVGFDVFECEALTIASRFSGVVVIEEPPPVAATRAHVQAWIKLSRPPRVIVVSSKPATWKALSLAHSDHVFVIPAPAFGWDIVDALRAGPAEAPRRA